MAVRIPGPTGQDQLVDQGTLARTEHAPPGPVCDRGEGFSAGKVGDVIAAIDLAGSRHARDAIARHTTEEFYTIISALLPGLLIALGAVAATTLAGAGIGALFGGVGAGPGAAVGFQAGLWLLNVLGVGFLLVYIGDHLHRVTDQISRGIALAWNSCGDENRLDTAAWHIAEGIGIFFALLLQAILLYITKAASEVKMAEALSRLRGSVLFRRVPKLLDWIRANYDDLCARFNVPKVAPSRPPAVRFIPQNPSKYTYNMVENPGPLAAGKHPVAANFAGGRYNEQVLLQDVVLYRTQPRPLMQITRENGAVRRKFGSDPRDQLGGYFSPEPPASRHVARIDNALEEFWVDPVTGVSQGTSTADVLLQVRVPKGTTVYYGPAAARGGVHVGGSVQVYVPNARQIVEIEAVTELGPATMRGVVDKLRR